GIEPDRSPLRPQYRDRATVPSESLQEEVDDVLVLPAGDDDPTLTERLEWRHAGQSCTTRSRRALSSPSRWAWSAICRLAQAWCSVTRLAVTADPSFGSEDARCGVNGCEVSIMQAPRARRRKKTAEGLHVAFGYVNRNREESPYCRVCIGTEQP